jgi:beta-galactosidase
MFWPGRDTHTPRSKQNPARFLCMTLNRREFLSTAIAAATLPAVLGPRYAGAQAPYTPPPSPRQKFNFNLDWRFLREESSGAEAPAFNDAKWSTVSLPHSFNDVDSFRTIISHGGGDRGTYKGIAWYRKHFKLPASAAGQRVFLEFEGLRQAADIYLNGKAVGLYENGVTAYGIDITSALNPTGDNVLAVKVDNTTTYKERASQTTFEWNANDFNPDHGGINRHVWLHVMGKIHQTLPLFYGLESQGAYIHAGNFNIPAGTADLTVESEVRNGSGDRATVALTAVVVDHQGHVHAQFDADPVDMVDGEKSVIIAQGALKNTRWWSDLDPYLYDVYTILKVDGKVVDVERTVTGFRKAEFKGGVGTGGVYLNDKFTYLKGFAQRSADEWAAIGAGYPDWLHDYQAQLIRACHGNHMRWMHISPTRTDADALCRAGIIQVCPAGDKERDAVGRQWEQRVEVMRDTIIYFRNNPSILFWEAGNTVITPDHMTQMVALKKQWDPDGGRVIGSRGNGDDAANTANTPIAEYYGVMIGQDPKTDALPPCSAPTPPSAATAPPSSRQRTSATKAPAASGTPTRRPTTASRKVPTTPMSTPPSRSLSPA